MRMILWPAVLTLAITLLRLAGELQDWSPILFNREAGGGGALVGISWLPFLLGPYFAWKLARAGKGPKSAWKTAGLALVGVVAAIVAFGGVMSLGMRLGTIALAFVLTGATGFIPWKAWPELAKVLLVFALAARVPVVIVMLAAIFGGWGTHYDVLPPDPPARLLELGLLGRWFFIGFLPQLTVWIAQTLLMGTLFGAVVVAIGKPKPAA